jgi:hypothetical protein
VWRVNARWPVAGDVPEFICAHLAEPRIHHCGSSSEQKMV